MISEGDLKLNKSEKGARSEIDQAVDGTVTIHVWREYAAGLAPTTAERVWQIVSDFAGIKTIFPSLLSVNVTYPDATENRLNTVRYMTFAPPDGNKPLSASNPLALGVEELVEIRPEARRLAYTSVLGLPVSDYRSEMRVEGDDGCSLHWISSFRAHADNPEFAKVLAAILANGANEIAAALKIA